MLGLIVGWFYAVFFGMFCAVFVACFVASIGRIMWQVDKGCSRMVSGQKLACTGAAKELSGSPVRGSHAIAWLGSNLQPSGTLIRYAIAWVPRNCIAPTHFQIFNFGRP